MSKSCDTECETTATEGACHKPEPCSPSAEECPIECAAGMWKGSFFEAMRETQVDILKAKIHKAWGPMMEQVADALLESMEACWHAKLAQVHAAEAASGFKEKLHHIMTEEKNK